MTEEQLEIQALKKRVFELETALRPFQRALHRSDLLVAVDVLPSLRWIEVFAGITLDDLLVARAALEKESDD
jgi:hypothetical protein